MWVESFLRYLTFERNYSQRTVDEYRDDLKAFESFYKEEDSTLSWETIDADVVRDWMVFMMEQGRKPTTVNRRLSALRSFYRYLMKRDYVRVSPVCGIQGPKKEKPLPSFLKDSEMNRLLDGDFFSDDFQGRRDRLILNTLYVTGLRLSELTGLNGRDIDFENAVIKVTGKRNKQRNIPFGADLRQLMQSYLLEKNERGVESEGVFFVDGEGERLSNARVRKLVKYYLGLVSTLKKKSPHVLRHTFATSMLNHHADLESVKELLGHESISTTEVYTHMTFEELKKMYNQAHPRA